MNFRGKIPRASDTARSYDDGDPRADSAARRKVLEEKRAKQAEARAPQGVSAGGGERGGTVAISINGVAVGEVSALDLVPQGSVSIRATPLKGKLSLEIEGTASGTGGGGGPVAAPYVTTVPDPDLTNEQVLTDGTWIEWDISTPGVVIADIIAGSITTTELGGDITAAGEAILTAADASAQRTVLGLAAIASTGSASDLTTGTVPTARLGSGSATSSTYLRGDSTWQLLPSMTVSDGDKGDITVSSTGSVWTIDNDAVTLAKIQNAASSSTLLGSGSSGSGSDYAEITLGNGLSMSGTTLTASGDVTASASVISGTAVNSTSAVAVVSRSIDLAVGDILDFECTGTYLNTTGAAITPRIRFDVGSFTTTIVDGASLASNPSNQAVFWIRASMTILSTSSAAMTVELLRFAPTAANTRGAVAVGTHGAAWNTSASDQTGTKTCVLNVYSNGTGTTQTFTVHSYKFRKNGAI